MPAGRDTGRKRDWQEERLTGRGTDRKRCWQEEILTVIHTDTKSDTENKERILRKRQHDRMYRRIPD
ncbi:MAG: hypothetical protein U0L49_03550 [Eubacterium sp.]|nr:hypothetical protein [Eubacterium sp.]